MPILHVVFFVGWWWVSLGHLLLPGVEPRPAYLAPEIGTTYSQRQADERSLGYRGAFDEVLALEPDVVRVAAYWDEVATRGYGRLDWIMRRAAEQGQPVMLVLGMKAPRWPEFYIPSRYLDQTPQPWETIGGETSPDLTAALLRFISTTVMRYQDHSTLIAYQVENEPLDAAGPAYWRLDRGLLAEEVALVRSLDGSRPIALTFFVHLPLDCGLFRSLHSCIASAYSRYAVLEDAGGRLLDLLRPGDILGLDVYPVIGEAVASEGWPEAVSEWVARANARGVRAWVTEAQAEPWPLEDVAAHEAILTPQRSEDILLALERTGAETILLWGSEFWIDAARQGDQRWMPTSLER